MSVAIHFAAAVSVSETASVESPRAARKAFTWTCRSASVTSSVAASADRASGLAMAKSALGEKGRERDAETTHAGLIAFVTLQLRDRYGADEIVTSASARSLYRTVGRRLARAMLLRLLRQRLGELRDPKIRGIEPLRAVGVEAHPLFVQAHGLVEIE